MAIPSYGWGSMPDNFESPDQIRAHVEASQTMPAPALVMTSADLHAQLYGPGGTGLGPGYVAGPPAADAPVFRSQVRVIDPLWILAGLVVVVLLWRR